MRYWDGDNWDQDDSAMGDDLRAKLGLIDEYQLFLHPVVLGLGRPFFVGPQPRLRLVASDRIGEDVIRLKYVPAKSEC
jgi:dihydrofolate reductase